LARDRKRAKQRRERSARGARSLSASKPVRTEVPGSLEHASGDADEFEAAIVRGADGATLPAQPGETPEQLEDELAEAEADRERAAREAVPDAEDGKGGGDDLLQEAEAAFGRRTGRGGGGGGGGGAQAVAERPSGAPLRGGNRVIGFLRASWAELQRVQWPDRRQVTQATAVVLGFVVVAGVYLGVADLVAKEIVEAIL
jgi:preprotein translocase subunit SecE